MRATKESKLELWMKTSVAIRRVLYIDRPTVKDVRAANMLANRYARLYNESFKLNRYPSKE